MIVRLIAPKASPLCTHLVPIEIEGVTYASIVAKCMQLFQIEGCLLAERLDYSAPLSEEPYARLPTYEQIRGGIELGVLPLYHSYTFFYRSMSNDSVIECMRLLGTQAYAE